MTGEKNRYTTTEKLWKIDDKHLSTPKHDELVLQLLNSINASKCVELLGLKHEMCPQIYSGYNDGYAHKYTKEEIELLKDKTILDIQENDRRKVQINSEVPIKTNNGFLVGYVDIQIQIPIYLKYIIEYDTESGLGVRSLGCEYVSQRDMQGIGYIECTEELWGKMKQPEYGRWSTYWDLNVEVKPYIDSFGETLRQINTYRCYTKNDIYIIYSPDTRFKEAFKTQGIEIITPQDIGIKM